MAKLGLIASVIQLAGAGLELSISLQTFAETVSSADKNIRYIDKDGSLTAAVLRGLGSKDKKGNVASHNVRTADDVVAGLLRMNQLWRSRPGRKW